MSHATTKTDDKSTPEQLLTTNNKIIRITLSGKLIPFLLAAQVIV